MSIIKTDCVTPLYKLHTARQIKEAITEVANTSYYVFQGGHVPYANTTPDLIYLNDEDTQILPYKNMIQGKRVADDDVALVVRKIIYQTNTMYTMFDDKNKLLLDKDFYVSVTSGAYNHVFKCLDNNNNALSTVEPSFATASASDNYEYRESDGYVWKYLYSFSSTENLKFSTDAFIPVYSNTTVVAAAKRGVIDVIKIDEAGRGYDNYLTGTFAPTDIKVNGDPLLYAIGNNMASATNGHYTSCLLYLSTGTGSGQYRDITAYESNGLGRFIRISSAFNTSPVNGTQYEITPAVSIIGTGQTSNAVARALVNALAANSIHRIEMLESGENYIYSSAQVLTSNVIDVQVSADIRPIQSPKEGHGYDPAKELGATRLCFSVKFSNSESNTILTSSKFQQVGLLKDPLFSNVILTFANTTGSFISGEAFYKVNPKRFDIGSSVQLLNATVTSTGADFTKQIAVGDFIYVVDNNSTGVQELVTVLTVTNSSVFTVQNKIAFTSSNCSLFYTNATAHGTVANVVNSTAFSANKVVGTLQIGDRLVGNGSGVTAVLSNVTRNTIVKDFNTFVQLYNYRGTLQTGAFSNDELIQQVFTIDTVNSTARFYSGNSTSIYTSGQQGDFKIVFGTNSVVGNTSGATFLLSEIHPPEVEPGSGDILYLNNITPVYRSANTSEQIKFILEF